MTPISTSTVWRWLHTDAIRPWQHRCWIFNRDPEFAAKAGRILDLYARGWEGEALPDDEFVLSADGKTSIQTQVRCHASAPPQPGQPINGDEYVRGTLAYVATLDVHPPSASRRYVPRRRRTEYVSELMNRSA